MEFIAVQKEKNDLPVDFVYTGKALAGIYDLIRRGEIHRSSNVLMLHTGGLQTMTLPK